MHQSYSKNLLSGGSVGAGVVVVGAGSASGGLYLQASLSTKKNSSTATQLSNLLPLKALTLTWKKYNIINIFIDRMVFYLLRKGNCIPIFLYSNLAPYHSVLYDPISAHFFPCGYNPNLRMRYKSIQ